MLKLKKEVRTMKKIITKAEFDEADGQFWIKNRVDDFVVYHIEYTAKSWRH